MPCFFFFFVQSLLPPPSPSSSSSTLFVQTILFPSPHVQILNVFSPPSASSGKHLYAYEKRRERAEGRASKARAYQGNQAANICWQLLDNISLPLFEGGGGSPATHANEAAREKNKKTSGVWEVTELLHFIKGARAMQPFSVNP